MQIYQRITLKMGICNNSAIKDDSCSICCFCLDLLENGKFCSKFRSPHLPLDRLVEYGPFNPQNETCFFTVAYNCRGKRNNRYVHGQKKRLTEKMKDLAAKRKRLTAKEKTSQSPRSFLCRENIVIFFAERLFL